MERPCIYAICHPFTDDIVYIGKTCNLTERMKIHLRLARRCDKRPLYQWMAELLKYNLAPKVKVLKECEFMELSKLERFYINKLRSNKLLNVANFEKG